MQGEMPTHGHRGHGLRQAPNPNCTPRLELPEPWAAELITGAVEGRSSLSAWSAGRAGRQVGAHEALGRCSGCRERGSLGRDQASPGQVRVELGLTGPRLPRTRRKGRGRPAPGMPHPQKKGVGHTSLSKLGHRGVVQRLCTHSSLHPPTLCLSFLLCATQTLTPTMAGHTGA